MVRRSTRSSHGDRVDDGTSFGSLGGASHLLNARETGVLLGFPLELALMA
jgi:hypothetical protein